MTHLSGRKTRLVTWEESRALFTLLCGWRPLLFGSDHNLFDVPSEFSSRLSPVILASLCRRHFQNIPFWNNQKTNRVRYFDTMPNKTPCPKSCLSHAVKITTAQFLPVFFLPVNRFSAWVTVSRGNSGRDFVGFNTLRSQLGIKQVDTLSHHFRHMKFK